MEFMNVRRWQNGKFSRHDVIAIAAAVSKVRVTNFNEITIAHVLNRFKLIDHDKFMMVLRSPTCSHNLLTFLLAVLNENGTFSTIVHVLNDVGQVQLAKCLRQERFNRFWIPCRLSRVELPFGLATLKEYGTVKTIIDNRLVANWTQDQLQERIVLLDQIINSAESYEKRQKFLELRIALTVLSLQRCRDTNHRRRVLLRMRNAMPRDLNVNTLDVVYESKMAVTEALEGNEASAKEHIQNTKQLIAPYMPCFASVSAILDIESAQDVLYCRNQTPENLEEVLNTGYFALQHLQEVDGDISVLWKHLYFQIMVLGLLGFNYKFSACDIARVSSVNIEKARHIIREIEKTSRDLSARRVMILNLAKARTFEPLDIGEARAFARMADLASNMATYMHFDEERDNIHRYYISLAERDNR